MSGSNLCNERSSSSSGSNSDTSSDPSSVTQKTNKCNNKQISFIKRFNPFGSSSSTQITTLKCKIDDIKYRDRDKVKNNTEFRKSNEYRDVKSLKQFWNDHILSSNDPSDKQQRIKQKSATLTGNISAKCLEEFNDENYSNKKRKVEIKELNLKSRASSVPSLNIFKNLKSPEKTSVRLKSYNSIDNFDKYKSAETVKNRRHSKEDSPVIIPNFPLVATSGGEKTKIHWAKRDDLIFRKKSETKEPEMIIQKNSEAPPPSSPAAETKGKYDDAPSRKGSDIMVSDMVDMVMQESTTKTKLSAKASTDSQQSKVTRKISFRTTKNATPTNSYSRRLKHQENSSRVAALTLRFNEIIQQDVNLLKEVKKNGGIVHKVGGHVYKIVEEEAGKPKKGRGDSNDDASSVSSRQSRKKASVRRKASMKRPANEKSVKETIQLFEPSSEKKVNETKIKPKVPDKSETVKLRSQALRMQKQTSMTSLESKVPEIAESPDSTEVELKDDASGNNASHVGHYLKHDPDHKSKYSRMYEKMKFRSLFTTKKSDDDAEEVPEAAQEATEPISPDYKPNTSFLFRNATLPKNTYCSTNDIQSSLVEAINAALINKTRSMDENSFPAELSNEENGNFPQYSMNKSTLHEKNRLLSTIKVAESSTEAINEMCHEQSRIDDSYEYIRNNDDDKEKEDTEEIYQSLAEVKDNKRVSVDSYESVDEYQKHFNTTENKSKTTTDDGYELCDPPEPPPPRKPSTIDNPDNAPVPLPAPKRIVHDNYEHVKYTDIPPRPPAKPEQVPLPPRNGTQKVPEPEPEHDDHHDYYEENIYDTIKHADNQSLLSSCYEAIQQRSKMNGDTASLLYDSVKNEFNRFGHFLQHADSTLTLASDQKTNSIYGTSMSVEQSITPPSERGSDNSDEWVDISEDEGNNPHKFVIIREKQQKTHKNTEWSKKVRDQHKNHRESEDDFDHHYESLCSMEQAKQKLEAKLKERPLILLPPSSDLIKHGHHEDHDDSFDSFESDCESDTEIKKADSGVDIHNAKLPDPPQQPKQVYALMQKIKSFGSISKSEISKGFNKIRKKSMTSPKTDKPLPVPGQPYENTTFYVPTDMNATTLVKEKPAKKKNTRRSTVSGISLKIEETQPYENHDFHSPVKIAPLVPSSISSPVLSHATTPSKVSDAPDFSRKKSKSGRSFKSKLRKSFATDSSLSISSSTYGSSRSTFYISDSVDVDSGIFGNDLKPTSSGIPDNNSNKSNSSEKMNKMGVDEVILRNENRKSFSPDSGRRRSSTTTRPNNPPPPPPPMNGDKSRGSKKLGTTSWYAECGVFKPETFNGEHRNSKRDKSTSWYAEAGLYQTSGESVISSSGSSGVSTGGEGGPGDDTLHSMFINEPLYQIYNAARLESISRDIEIVTDTDGYEEVGLLKSQNSVEESVKKPLRPTALQLVEPNRGSSRTLWSEVPEVLATEILLSLTSTEKYLQEAKFEILTSEASYLKSLNLLKSHFMNHPAFRDTQILSAADRKTLFSYIIPVQECSDRLLSDLESCWQDNIMLIGLSESLQKHVEKYFHVKIDFFNF